jgi:hypothetical protein
MYDVYHRRTESESVVQRDIERPEDVHVRRPQRKARQLVVHDGRIRHDVRQNHVLAKQRVALRRVLCDCRAKALLEKDILHNILVHAIQDHDAERP